ncbi:MAG: hypothetical protein LBQ54_15295 [Planctomycetaceae bacterium]|nr:hypothetical protein [Planctomycetaceae bacterium]
MQRHVAPFALLTGIHRRNKKECCRNKTKKQQKKCGWKDYPSEAEWNAVTMRLLRWNGTFPPSLFEAVAFLWRTERSEREHADREAGRQTAVQQHAAGYPVL